ncbi:TetR family transcriptional regulator [Streptomyces misionensis]|uniref:TetR family transcriptional regulator n=2 Tax=Streptomyces misionensis TaxID=67331 RepID=A0A5C6J973_9ACTN|nr:TetR family transcriptional regulator [Streptomyces misionensis]
MEIARAAAALFVRQGLRATRAEDIARQAGIAPRTFYRYFATKEEAVAPLYAAGAQRWAEAVRTAPARLTVPQALEHAVEHTLLPGGGGVSAASWEWVRTLIRLTDTSPALRRVWAEVGQTSEDALAEILARRLASPAWAEPTRETAAGEENANGEESAGGAESAGGEDSAGGEEAATGEGVAAREAASAGAPVPVITPDLRFAAAVAGSAVRVAVKSWAATASPPAGPDGPAALALRNLKALDAFAWNGER